MKTTHALLVACLLLCSSLTIAAEKPPAYNDPKPQRYDLTARASQIDPRAKSHPEIDFVLEKGGKPADVQNASVDTSVVPRGKLAIWLMGHSEGLFQRVAGYGIHIIRPHYANGWFGKFGNLSPGPDGQLLGNIRLEAATGKDFSPLVNIPQPDGMMERAFQFVKWLSKNHPQGKWEQFITQDGKGLRWDKVIITGSSHGSTTAARFAKHQKVDRVVMFCGPRDQYDQWQSLPSATEPNRYFGFSHVLDGGWTGDHYCRSWEMIGLHQFGPIVNVDLSKPPFENTRRLITSGDVKNDAKRAHSSVTPGKASIKNASGNYAHEAVWKYLFTHPVDEVGTPTPADPDCQKDQKPTPAKPKKK